MYVITKRYGVKILNQEIFQLHADICKTLANAKRLKIMALLARGEHSVTALAEAIEVPLANISQHLRVLKSKNLVSSRQDGQTVYYNLVDRRIVDACDLIRAVLLDELKRKGAIAKEISLDNLVVNDVKENE